AAHASAAGLVLNRARSLPGKRTFLLCVDIALVLPFATATEVEDDREEILDDVLGDLRGVPVPFLLLAALGALRAERRPRAAHSHPHEEVWNVIEGQLEVTIDDEARALGPGSAAVVPPNTMHSARALTAAQAIVVDYPLRHSVGRVET